MSTLFNIREHVDEPQTPNADIQNVYNVINLSAFSFGELTFYEAYTIPFLELLEGNAQFPGLMIRWQEALTHNLITARNAEILQYAAQDACDVLRSELPSASMRDFCEQDLLSSRVALEAQLEAMSRATACIPFLRQTAEQKLSAQTLFANGFLNASYDTPAGLGDFTFVDTYLEAAVDYPVQHAKLLQARQVGVLGVNKINDKCCSNNTCVTMLNKFCSISSTTGKCSLGSNPC